MFIPQNNMLAPTEMISTPKLSGFGKNNLNIHSPSPQVKNSRRLIQEDGLNVSFIFIKIKVDFHPKNSKK